VYVAIRGNADLSLGGPTVSGLLKEAQSDQPLLKFTGGHHKVAMISERSAKHLMLIQI
jgi:hypothetical protein